MARQHVTVALSGDAGDELFGGYERYFVGRKPLEQNSPGCRPALKKLTAAALTVLPPRALNTGLGISPSCCPSACATCPVGDKLHKLAEVVAAPGMETLYLNLMSHWKQPADIVIDGKIPSPASPTPRLAARE